MKNKILTLPLIRTGILSAGIIAFGGMSTAVAQQQMPPPSQAGAAQQQGAGQNEIQQLQMEMQQVEERLSQIQQQASQDPAIVQLSEEFNETVITKMTEVDPRAEEKIGKQRELVDELVAMGSYQALEDEERTKYEQKVQVYQQIQTDLQEAQAVVLQDQNVQQMRNELNQELISKMSEIDEEAPALMEKREQLAARFEQIRQQAGGGAQPQPAPTGG
jgi:predicted transcriptional regulator